MKINIPLIFFLFSLTSLVSFSQTGIITGKVFEGEDQAAIYANVILKSAEDSSMVKGAISNDDGDFEIAAVSYGSYFLSVSFIGFNSYDSEIFQLSSAEKKMEPVLLTAANTELSEITVTALRPILEMKADKVVFNIDGTINAAGENALDLLRKSPGVTIDNNENVNLLGKSGVKVFIDGKESQLSGEDLSSFLKSMQSDQLDAIEIITNPSAKYEAEGNAGIINIKLKKDKNHGTNVFLNAGYAKGIKQAYNGSVAANHRNKWLNVFAKYGYSDAENANNMSFDRSQLGLQFVNNNDMASQNKTHNYRFGSDFFINSKSTVGFIVDAYDSKMNMNSDGTTTMKTIGVTEIDSVLIATSTRENESTNYNVNLNYKWDINKDEYFNIDVDYGKFARTSGNSLPNFYYNDFDKKQLFSERQYQIDADTDINIVTGKVDYERNFLGGKLGVGSKYASVKTDNVFEFYNVQNSLLDLDKDQSNKFIYTENVLAAYINYNGAFKKLTYQVGLRAENTDSKGELTTFNDQVEEPTERSYLDFFPSASISLPVNQMNSLQLSYTRRINRPTYQDLNPFLSKLDELTFQKGNEKLLAEYTNNIQLRHTFKYMYSTTLAYSRTNNVISRIVDIAEDGKGSFISKFNLAKQDHYSINIAAPITINKVWSTFSSLTAFHLHNKADYGEGKIVDFKVNTFNFYSQQNFKLPWSSSFEISGWYSSPSVWEGNFATDPMWSIDAGLQKSFLNDKAKVKLSVSDIFKSMGWSGNSEFGAMNMYGEGNWDSRRFKVNFSYAFGNQNVKSRKRNTGSEAENKRLQGDQ